MTFSSVLFLLQGAVLRPDAGRGVIVSNRSLVLQRVGRRRAGGYRCAASNSEGRAESDAVNLSIKCKCKIGYLICCGLCVFHATYRRKLFEGLYRNGL